jgi:hypothetical protein
MGPKPKRPSLRKVASNYRKNVKVQTDYDVKGGGGGRVASAGGARIPIAQTVVKRVKKIGKPMRTIASSKVTRRSRS